MQKPIRRLLLRAALASQLSACMLGPDYVPPKLDLPKEFKENKEMPDWKPAQPRDHVLLGNWWEVFNDSQLNDLAAQVAGANQSVMQAEAQYRQAQYLVLTAQSALSPVGSTTFTTNRFVAASGQNIAVSGVRNLFSEALSMSWQPDLWGTVRRQIEANTANAQASAATMQALRLSSQAALVTAYFQLKTQDAQIALLTDSLRAYEKTLAITRNRYAAGVAGKTDIVQAQTQVETVRAQVVDLGVLRAQYEHAIAVLIGKAPAELSIPPSPQLSEPPPLPPNLPSELLERRPDIAAAERKIAAANAQIGVTKAAYYPTFSLGVTDGWQSGFINHLITGAHRYWSLGPGATALTLFDGGAKNAQYKQAIANYDAAAAGYKQTVLTAIQQVEDNLAALRILQHEAEVQSGAVQAANQAVDLTINQYKAGTVAYLNVLTAQTTALSNQITAVQLKGSRLNAATQLATALGGGWDLKQLPDSSQIGGAIKWTDYLIIPGLDQGDEHIE